MRRALFFLPLLLPALLGAETGSALPVIGALRILP